ncbi:MAG: chaperone NapD [Gammaproteobacteria bacterium]|jgi:periplasmic nitrate reductase NapD|nr:chaperone NapD [Gammaproteobacteria bacterium]HEX5637592.1 chaperone NapD [Gammaproteobacteria bacterium]
MSEMNICGVLVHVKNNCVEQVTRSLQAIAGVEIHEVTPEGRMVVTIEGDNRRYVGDTLTGLYSVEGVLSACMVYQFSDEISDTEEGIPA